MRISHFVLIGLIFVAYVVGAKFPQLANKLPMVGG